MKPSFKIRTALRLADRLGTRARELRRDLRDHVRNESFRIQEAEKRARGLRLYAAWSRSHQPRPTHEAAATWHPAESAA